MSNRRTVSNLSPTQSTLQAISVDSLPASDDTYSIGSSSLRFKDEFLSGQLNLSRTSNQIKTGAGSNITTVTFPASSGAVTVTMPSSTDTVMARAVNETVSGIKSFSVAPVLTAASNQLKIQASGAGNALVFTAANPAGADRIVTFEDPGAAATVIYDVKAQTISGAKTLSGITTVSNSTESTASSNGALIVAGGLGLAKNLVMDQSNLIDFGANTGTKLRLFEAGASDYEIGIAASTLYTNVASTSDFVEFRNASTGRTRITNNTIQPVTTSQIDLGTSSLYFNNGFINAVTLQTTGGTGTALNYYEELTHTSNVTGIWAAAQAVTMKLTRIGNQVNVQFNNVSAAATINATIALDIALPARFRPGQAKMFFCKVMDNSADVSGTVEVLSTGFMTWRVGIATSFTSSGNGGFYGGAVSYQVW
jgi:hypothetical protein